MKIGIVAQETNGVFGVNNEYMEWAERFGTPIVISPVIWEDWNRTFGVDGIILPGGADVLYSRHSKLPSYTAYAPNIHLEHFDKEILPNILGKIPVFGICRGLQTLNVVLGGTLRQDILGHGYSSNPAHEVHEVVRPEHPTKKLFGVNSFHHQAVDRLGHDITIELASDSDLVVEAISSRKYNFFAVQWHPERLGDDYSALKAKDLFRG